MEINTVTQAITNKTIKEKIFADKNNCREKLVTKGL